MPQPLRAPLPQRLQRLPRQHRQQSAAGKIDLGRGEKATAVKHQLRLASKEVGIKVRSSWEDKQQRVLLWKKVGR